MGKNVNGLANLFMILPADVYIFIFIPTALLVKGFDKNICIGERILRYFL